MIPLQYLPAGTDMTLKVGGNSRLVRVVSPTIVTALAPVVVCFHGGGGKAYYAVDEFAIQKFWPEALVYYAQGQIEKGGFTSWSSSDLPFFEAMRANAIHHQHGDPNRIFVMGYSTGANFAASLWSRVGHQIAGFAFVSGGRFSPSWQPKPVYLSYGQEEPESHRLAATGVSFSVAAAKTGIIVMVIPRSGGHTFPQYQDRELAEFLKRCPPLVHRK